MSKYKSYIKLAIFILSFSASYIIFSNYLSPEYSLSLIDSAPRGNVEERLKDEFNLLKDPATGKIPDGIREKEIAFAKSEFLKRGNSITSNTYTSLGPVNLGGRSRDFVVDVNNNTTIALAGGVSSGIFRTTNFGTSWTKVTPNNEIHNVTAIAQDPTGAGTTWYYGTGEGIGNSANETGATYRGNGMYKSLDNGLSWSRLDNFNTGTYELFDNFNDYVYRIIVNPTNGDVFAATMTSIFKSTDGGASWELVLGLGAGFYGSAMFTDLTVHSSGTIYASFAGSCGTSDATVGQPASTALDGVWKSTTGGAAGSWTKIAGTGVSVTGWNSVGQYGRVVLAVAPNDVNTVYALYYNNTTSSCAGTPAPEADFFVTIDGGTSWTDISSTLPDEDGCLNGNDPFAVQTGYDLTVSVKPDDKTFVVIGGTNAYRSTNSGGTWTRIGGYASAADYAKYTNHHPDIHALVFLESNNNKLVSATDGGLHLTNDITATPVVWNSLNNSFVTYQNYYVALDPTLGSQNLLTGNQDNGTTYATGGSASHTEVFGGDGVSVGISSGNTYHYLGYQNGWMGRRGSGDPLNTATLITPDPFYGSIFVTLFHLDPDNTEILYMAMGSRLARTKTASTVTRTVGWDDMTGIFNTITGNIRAIETTCGTYTSNSKMYIGTQSGKLYRLNDHRDAATTSTPVDITGASFPVGGSIVGIAANPADDKEVLVVFSNYGIQNVWHTTDASVASPTWTSVEGNISLPSVRSCKIVKKSSSTEYYIGTSVGLWSTSTLNGSSTVWAREGASTIKYAVVRDIKLRPSDGGMLIGTHGNGVFYTTVSGSILPVELTSFTYSIQDREIKLEWLTATEVNNYGFEVERTLSNSWETVGFVEGYGNSNSPKEYSFVDESLQNGTYSYRLKQIDFDGKFEYSDEIEVEVDFLPTEFALHQNYPNPFNPTTKIEYNLPVDSEVLMEVYNSLGEKVTTLVNQIVKAGHNEVTFNANNLSSGIYLYSISTGSFNQVRKMMLLK